MSTGERESDSPATAEAEPEAPRQDPSSPSKFRSRMVGPCKKRVKVVIPRADVEKQFTESLGEMTREAQVPGFRTGHAPKALVEKRFRKEVANQVKSTLLMASLEQLEEDYKLNPITQPELDFAAIELPDDGPMKFEIEVEVRPDFPVPAYKGLTVKRPVKTIGETDIDTALKTFLEQLMPSWFRSWKAGLKPAT